eukprot:gene24672-27894_t
MSSSPSPAAVKDYLLDLQNRIVQALEQLDGMPFLRDAWDRPEGGGGISRLVEEGNVLERGGCNFSHVMGAALPPSDAAARPELGGRAWEATGVSLVLHPRNPYAPTVHMNVRFFSTTAADGTPVWWFGGGMDLTPYYGFEEDARHFHQTCANALAPYGDELHPRFKRWCDEYFYLKHRKEARGVGGIFFDDFNAAAWATLSWPPTCRCWSAGRPLDNLGPLHTTESAPINVRPANPLGRAPIVETLDVGVRSINAMLTVGRGQRMGLFAGSGVGKSVLLGMMARYTEADVIVVGLIGERGREVKEFIEQILGEEGLARSVVVAAPADTPPLMRMQGAAYSTAIAEYFRDQGQNVLLIMDSLTRYAMAQREIALAIGEPPATKGYPPSVFAKLPILVERAGNGEMGGGSITAFYTVLTEGDDQQDPIADSARAILDGHIVLNRRLAEAGHYPAIDIEQSISRAMHSITSHEHQTRARHLKQLFSRYERSRDLIAVARAGLVLVRGDRMHGAA